MGSPTPSARPARTHSSFFAGAGPLAVVLLAGGWWVAVQRPVPSWEISVFQTVNGWPEVLADLLWPVMQLGSLLGPMVVGAVALVFTRRLRPAADIVLAGFVAWWVAKGVKAVVERGRPPAFVDSAVVRDGTGDGLGFVSGHTSVAFAVATVLAPEFGIGGRIAVYVIASCVGLARVSHGVHFPVDVIGGAGAGILCGLGVRLLLDRLVPEDEEEVEDSGEVPAD